jgi:tetratricopeptide (TPR) repeat protein
MNRPTAATIRKVVRCDVMPIRIALSVTSLLMAASVPFVAQAQTEPFSTSYRFEARKQYAAAAKPLVSLAEAGNEFAALRLAWLAYLEGKHDVAERSYRELIERKPNSVEPRLGIMLPLMALGRWDEAIAQGQMVLLQSGWDYVAHTRLLACEEALGQWERVEQHALSLSEAFPSDTTALLYLARARQKRNDDAAAKEAYQQVLQRAPSNPEANSYMRKVAAKPNKG